jgi:hypothetical protein
LKSKAALHPAHGFDGAPGVAGADGGNPRLRGGGVLLHFLVLEYQTAKILERRFRFAADRFELVR